MKKRLYVKGTAALVSLTALVAVLGAPKKW